MPISLCAMKVRDRSLNFRFLTSLLSSNAMLGNEVYTCNEGKSMVLLYSSRKQSKRGHILVFVCNKGHPRLKSLSGLKVNKACCSVHSVLYFQFMIVTSCTMPFTLLTATALLNEWYLRSNNQIHCRLSDYNHCLHGLISTSSTVLTSPPNSLQPAPLQGHCYGFGTNLNKMCCK